MEWKDEYNTGVGDVDRQHRYFVSLISSMDDGAAATWSRDRFRVFLAEIQRFAHYHFRAEETLMEVYGFDEREEHRAEHTKLSLRVAEFVTGAERGTLEPAEVRQFLHDWFSSHESSDRPLAEHVLRQQKQLADG
jgi:hemerythrin-like metal-binding protein